MVEDAELAPGGAAVVEAGEDAGVAVEEFEGLGGGLAEEFDAEVLEAELAHLGDVFGGGLGGGVEEGVAAAGVGDEGVGLAFAVAEVDGVFFAGAAAVAVVLAGGQGGGGDPSLGFANITMQSGTHGNEKAAVWEVKSEGKSTFSGRVCSAISRRYTY